ncbi:uncharacterized protein LOC131857034 [Cryptomeria japonica]|uniref:uncharacterized protein LOC131857034 n=1 Tax=Cryptomeria japonica TaxID=3369 RepID=UPI0027DA0C31|nr:uncharacterized protein LOC131857034 [Cryptomeria japonica]
MAVWAYRITFKKTIRTSPFDMVYGSKARMPINNLLHLYKFIHENNLEMSDPLEERMATLVKLDESREDSHRKNLELQQKKKNGEDSHFLTDMNGEMQELLVHGQFLKHLFA